MQRAFLVCLEPGWSGDPVKFKNITTEKDKFYRSPINESLEIWDCGIIDCWQIKVIKFFKNAESRAVAYAISSDENASGDLAEIDTKIGRTLGRAAQFDSSVRSRLIWIQGDFSRAASFASEFLRASLTLNTSAFEDINNVKFVADAKGVALIDSSFESTTRANNLLHTIALACAYQATLNDAIESLAYVATQTNSESENQLRRWSRFLSAYYFHEPIKPTTVELIHFYEKIRERQRISSQYYEVTDQLKLLAELVHIDRAEESHQQAAIDTYKLSQQSLMISKKGFWVTFFAFLVALSSVTQCTPKAINDIVASWHSCYIDGWTKCIANNSELKSNVTEPLIVRKPLKKSSPTKDKTLN
jgi:hypothetical protein